MHRLKVGLQLAIGFGALIMLFVAFGVFSLFKANELSGLTERLYKHPYAVGTTLRDMETEIVAMHRSMKDVALSQTPEQIDIAVARVAAEEKRVLKNFEIIYDRFLGDKAMIDAAKKEFTEWAPIRNEAIEATRAGNREGAGAITKGKGAEKTKKIDNALTVLLDFANDKAEAFHKMSGEVRQTSQRMIVVALIGVFALGLFAAWFISRGITRAIGTLCGSMSDLAAGNNEAEIPLTEMSNEIGEMAKAVAVFRDNAIERERLEAEQREAQAAREDRQRRVDSLITDFRSKVQHLLQSVGANMNQMQMTAKALGEIAEGSAKRATETAASSEEASTNVQTVASAAEELAASIEEIARKVSETTEVVGSATEAARTSNERVASLDEAAQKIGDVVSLIQDIAEQTNLLALNATIEAARAGDAGRGFAVVASEVKTLAEQTAKATEQIAQQIGAIQTSTTEAVDSITLIARTMEQVNEYAAMIAAAVEEQGSATAEISRNVQQAADGTRYVAENMAGMTSAAADTNRSAEEADAHRSTRWSRPRCSSRPSTGSSRTWPRPETKHFMRVLLWLMAINRVALSHFKYI